MKSKHLVALSLAALVLFVPGANASYQPRTQPNDSHVVVLKISDLRSAYLQRAGIVRYDSSNMSPEGLRRQLQRHFDVVLGMLLVSSPRSIETALTRLEAASGHAWSDEKRAGWRNKLATNRYLQMQRLAAYRDAGRFPLNEGQSSRAVPIFVDRHDTACAVGHLMRLSGWKDEVAKINETNNLVYVPDAFHSDVTSWALTSGLTIEEAALIQPGYTPVAPFLISDYEPGELMLSQGGLQYGNFQFSAQNYIFSGALTFHQSVDTCNGCTFTPTSSGSLTLPSKAIVGFNAGSGVFTNNAGDNVDPIGNRWLSIGGAGSLFGAPPNRLIGGQTQLNTIQRIVISFDVAALGAGNYLNMIAEHSYPTYSGFLTGFFGPGQGQYEMTTEGRTIGNTLLATTNFDETPLPPPGQFDGVRKGSSGSFSQISSIHVQSTLWLYNGATVDSVVFGFQLVPEPSFFCIAISGLMCGCGVRFRRRN
jgi:hypothetical protein